ncbi:alpha-1,2-mannosyltransferase ALG9 [Onthophagus taurus]|uniref:alpha-1,2-mannosyltransferase ALG9 n=1 Tax=Onthophagus taurus TaxID=166361 RepID=UPI0039BDE3DF
MGRNPPSLKLRQQNGNHSKKESKKETQKRAQQQQKRPEPEINNLLYPSGDTAFKAILLTRFCAAIWSHITDCDETYNYWEPMHYLIFDKGLQTWEYSPEFALRSYTYLLIHGVPGIIYQRLLRPNPLLIFYFIRCLLVLLCSFVEVFFYKAVCREFGVHIGRMCLVFQLFSAGMFISCSALLPSSWAMYMCFVMCGAWWMQKYELAIFATALGALLGWPFAAVLGVPLAVDMLIMKKMYKTFLQWSIISAGVILVPMVITDSLLYGKLVIAPLNILIYNVFGGAGPNLYGVEPLSYYLINGFLNFNLIWIFALTSPLALILSYILVPSKQKSTLTLPHYFSLSPLFLWLFIFFLQPHKEERFLFPIYPLICLSGAITVDIIQKLYFRVLNFIKTVSYGTHYLDCTVFIMVGSFIITSLLGLSRIYSLYSNYHASMDIMMELNRYSVEGKISENAIINVCLGKDWHRYPNSFFLPNNNWNVRFIKSEFTGILPFPYTESDNGTKIVHKHFNDQNREEPSVYFDLNKCHFLIDLDLEKETLLEPNYSKKKDYWKVLKVFKFLDAEKSHRLFRAFYIPYFSEKNVKYGSFLLMQNVKIGKLK